MTPSRAEAIARVAGYQPSRRDPLLFWRREPPLVYYLYLGKMPPRMSWGAPPAAPEAKLREDLLMERARLLGMGLDVALDERHTSPGGVLFHGLGDEP